MLSARVESSTAEAASPQLFVSMADTKAQPVHLSDTSFQPVTGNAAYRRDRSRPREENRSATRRKRFGRWLCPKKASLQEKEIVVKYSILPPQRMTSALIRFL